MAGITAPQRTRRSRRPTGMPNPPLILLTGLEKTGKSFEAARGTGSDLIGRSFWIEIGGTEGTADYYGRVPGANYEIVEHDGSYQDILDAIRWVNHQPRIDGKPNLLVIDTMTSLWDMLSDEVARYARNRAIRKAERNRSRVPTLDDPVIIDPDLWNRAKDRWGEVLWQIRRHQGPCLLLARTEIVTAFENDKPTRNTVRKIKAERNLAAAVDAIVDLHGIGDAWLTGVRSLHMEIRPGESQRFADFTVDALLRRLGLQDAAETRSVSEARPDATLGEPLSGPPAVQKAATLTSGQAAEMIRRALMHPREPEAELRAIREQHGRLALRSVATQTAWGAMSADDLIDRSLEHLKAKAEQAQDAAAQRPHDDTSETDCTAQTPNGPEATPPRTEPEEPEPASDDSVPPPPDPQQPEPEPEPAEEISEAEEPQDLPRRPARPTQATKVNRVMTVLFTEAEIQARTLGISREQHLSAIASDGNPPTMAKLRNHVARHRPDVAHLLEVDGHHDIADAYRRAGTPELKIAQLFAPLHADLAATE
ncbi:hypothetical protein AB0C52_13190 [Streptomyces sp. NPDC048717]|uniref:hypothetical protein n=1 Tax=Streptomyces sp. NPDC048717 TaxID=3154928 RepID=UPI0034316C12